MSQWSSGDMVANGIRLHYHRTGGNKPPLVLLHGLTDSGLCWTPVAERLADRYDLIMIDARGHGLSDVPERGYGSDDHAADVESVIDALALEKPALLGHSMGAATAATLAAKAPHLLSCIILEDPPWREKQLSEEERMTIAAEWRKHLIEGQSTPRERLMTSCRLEHPRWSEGEIGPWAEAKQQVSPNVMDYITARNTLWPELTSRITCPTLLITADPAAGAIVTANVASEAHNLLHDGQVLHIESAGHSIRREQFEPFMACVSAFLESCYG